MGRAASPSPSRAEVTLGTDGRSPCGSELLRLKARSQQQHFPGSLSYFPTQLPALSTFGLLLQKACIGHYVGHTSAYVHQRTAIAVRQQCFNQLFSTAQLQNVCNLGFFWGCMLSHQGVVRTPDITAMQGRGGNYVRLPRNPHPAASSTNGKPPPVRQQFF